jgi:hypothetical protein
MREQRQQTDEENSNISQQNTAPMHTAGHRMKILNRVFSEMVIIMVFDIPVLPALFSVLNSCGDI